jgi:ribosomal protein L16/L10AE
MYTYIVQIKLILYKNKNKFKCSFLRYSTIKKSTQRSFKKRFPLIGNQPSFFNNSLYKICIPKPVTFEFIYWRRLKRVSKRLIKRVVRCRRKIRHKYFKKNIWVFLKPNFPISRKSKNSRMGKGVGAFSRWTIRLYSNTTLLKLRRFSYIRVYKLATWIEQHFYIPVIFY